MEKINRKDEDCKLGMPAGASIVFGAVIADVFNIFVSPKRSWGCEASFHSHEDVSVKEDSNRDDGSFEFFSEENECYC